MDGITLEHIGDTTILRCSRALTINNISEFMALFGTLIQRSEMERIMFVLSPQTKVDASGIGFLVQMHAMLVGGNKRLYLCMLPQEALEILKQLELTAFLRILTSEEALLLRLPD